MLLDRLIAFFSSLKLTVGLLALAMGLVFAGTLAQVERGVYQVQAEFFRSFFIFWSPAGAGWKIPVFPGGYLIGAGLLLNLAAALWVRLRFGKGRMGALLTHGGLGLLLLGQLASDLLSVESHMRLREGQALHYSEHGRLTELALVDVSDPTTDTVVAIPDALLARRKILQHPELPFTVHVRRFLPNAVLSDRPQPGFEAVPATEGIGRGLWFKELPRTSRPDRRDLPGAIVEVQTPSGTLGPWLVSVALAQPQAVTVNGHTWQLSLRFRRYYKPFALQLLKFTHDKYPGSDIPRNFSSRLRLWRPDPGEEREVLIKMNNPLRYGGETFYQSGYDENDPHVTILQVVRNPGWLTPYVACTLVSLGLLIQFLSRLAGFLRPRRRQ